MSDKLFDGMWSVTFIGAEVACAVCNDSKSPTIIAARQNIFRSSITSISKTALGHREVTQTSPDTKLASPSVARKPIKRSFDRMGEIFFKFSNSLPMPPPWAYPSAPPQPSDNNLRQATVDQFQLFVKLACCLG